MRCNECGSIMQHFLIAEGGKNFYRCTRPLTKMNKDGSRGKFILCETVQDATGEVIQPGRHLFYLTNGKEDGFEVMGRRE
jgi:hypothetical protein